MVKPITGLKQALLFVIRDNKENLYSFRRDQIIDCLSNCLMYV